MSPVTSSPKKKNDPNTEPGCGDGICTASPDEALKLLQRVDVSRFVAGGWYDTAKNEIPTHKGPFLVNVEGVHYKAVYLKKKKLFKVVDELRETNFRIENQPVKWKCLAREN